MGQGTREHKASVYLPDNVSLVHAIACRSPFIFVSRASGGMAADNPMFPGVCHNVQAHKGEGKDGLQTHQRTPGDVGVLCRLASHDITDTHTHLCISETGSGQNGHLAEPLFANNTSVRSDSLSTDRDVFL